MKASIIAERPAVAPTNAPTIHTFEPQSFHLQFSDSPAPVLRIFPGDTVRTRTLDQGHREPAAAFASLKELTVKLDPMLGGVGVAPPDGQAISTSDLGVFGGNLDYQGIREGATLYLPVFTRVRCCSWVTGTPCRARVNCRARAWRRPWMWSSRCA